MQVVTLNERQLDKCTKTLAEMIATSDISGFDALIAIRRGGSFVCDSLCCFFPPEIYKERYDITIQRPTTKKKNCFVGAVLKALPYPLLNFLRVAEAFFLTGRKRQKVREVEKIHLPDRLIEILIREEEPKVLIVDDAIDSGNTLFAIENSLKEVKPEIRIRVAVLTVTTSNPIRDADYYLYHNGTLIRFPWSNDYKKIREI